MNVGDRPGESQESGISSRSLKCVRRIQILEPSSAASQAHYHKPGWESQKGQNSSKALRYKMQDPEQRQRQ